MLDINTCPTCKHQWKYGLHNCSAIPISALPPEHEVLGALTAWKLAIESKLKCTQPYPNEESIEDLAISYGFHITSRHTLELVSTWFNWDEITTYLKGTHASPH